MLVFCLWKGRWWKKYNKHREIMGRAPAKPEGEAAGVGRMLS